jgi:hypothetical protein
MHVAPDSSLALYVDQFLSTKAPNLFQYKTGEEGNKSNGRNDMERKLQTLYFLSKYISEVFGIYQSFGG